MMLLHRFFLLLTAVLLSYVSVASANVSDTDTILKAHSAYTKKDIGTLSTYAQQLKSKQDILAPYAEYWLMLLQLDYSSHQNVTDFIERYQDYAFTDYLRGAYLKKLGKQQDWSTFRAELDQFPLKDTGVTCYQAEADYLAGDKSALLLSKPLWLQGKDQPDACTRLFDHMQTERVLTHADIWSRFRLALAANRVRLAKSILKRTSAFQTSQLKYISLANKSPHLIVNKRSLSFDSQFGREVYLYAIDRIARKSPEEAANKFRDIKRMFSQEEQSYAYGRLALRAAKDHELIALTWFDKAKHTELNTEQMAWYARAALREKNWKALLQIIDSMSVDQAHAARWRYWKARALKTMQKNEEANALLAPLSSERHYYGWLAKDDLDGYFPMPQPNYKANNEEVKLIGQLPEAKRVEALLRADLRKEASREWRQLLEGMHGDDKKLIAAAGYAIEKEWFDIGIYAADATRGQHDFSLRYPMPYRNLMQAATARHRVNEAWAYGITRQESRFMHYAKSRVGAAGLMQLMPATAKWAAPRAGISNYKSSMIRELDTNIELGTYYLSYTLNKMGGHQPVATAAYNAGPSRAKKWLADKPLEGAIYAETIPFNETRVYVQRVMANAQKYAEEMGLEKITLKQRMGVVPAKLSFLSNID